MLKHLKNLDTDERAALKDIAVTVACYGLLAVAFLNLMLT